MRPAAVRRALIAVVAALATSACAYDYSHVPSNPAAALAFFRERPAVVAPADNPTTPEKIALGRDLFNDTRLSHDGSTSCASCHQAALGFADGLPKARGKAGRSLERHTPTLWNVAFAPRLFMDGRAESLEAQALKPVMSGSEMGRHPGAAIDPIRADAGYRARFSRAFPATPMVSEDTVAKAIAAYERTLVSGVAPFDRWARGDQAAISDAAKRGFGVFVKGGCASCHSGGNFSDGRFHDVGLPDADLGRGAITKSTRLDHGFRTPSLREISRTAPYMHDGSLPDLAAVVDHYSDRVGQRRGTPVPARFSAAQKQDLIAFLHALESEGG